jgi:aminoglycoside phosphotransferase (APT) family kinase protein
MITASVNGGVVQDAFFRPDYEKGPFPSIKAYHDWMFAAGTHQSPGEDGIIKGLDHPHMYRDLLPDNGKVYFTHGDLTLRNIMVSGDPGSCRVTAILDWEQAGWYPEYWEFCKMHFGAAEKDEWSIDDWPSNILEPDEDAYWAFSASYEWRTGGT